ncbi:hypothetical protein BOX15_Mlig025122g1 [Macrostomum lignano]|uniref:Uncharacterized protein n=1 Tax=Macrostomum lignano TaxID=282301 RepID=A0A267GFQ0_9PLAT|nr:hypothetical protein BOX15_Mlig025122g1 [Macrostomum lignano]
MSATRHPSRWRLCSSSSLSIPFIRLTRNRCFNSANRQLQPLKTSISETIQQPLPSRLSRKRKREELCSYTLSELYQVILSSQADALIQLGAAPASQFRSGLFRMWCLYLSRTNEAFLTEAQRPSSQNKKPAKGWGGLIVPEPGGGGVGRGRTVRQKRARPDKITEADLADTLAQLSAAGGELCDLGLAREDSDDSDADFYTSISDDADDDELDDDAHSITSQSVARSLRRLLRHDESSKSRGQPSSEQPPPPGLRSTFRARQLASAGRPLLRTRLAGQKLNETNLALLYITCQLEASVASPIVCLSHLLHLVAVGQVPYFDSLRRLPERYCVTEPGVAAMLRRSSAPRYDTLVEIVARLSSLLSIRVFPRHRFLTICAYVIDRMRLPDQLTEFVSRLATRLLGNYSARHPLSNQDVTGFEIEMAKSAVYFEVDKLAISLVLLALCYLSGIGCPDSREKNAAADEDDEAGCYDDDTEAESAVDEDADDDADDDAAESELGGCSGDSSAGDDADSSSAESSSADEEQQVDVSDAEVRCKRETVDVDDDAGQYEFKFEPSQQQESSPDDSWSPTDEQEKCLKQAAPLLSADKDSSKSLLFNYSAWFSDYRRCVSAGRICDRPAWYPDYLAWSDRLLSKAPSSAACQEVGGDDWPAETRAELGQPSAWRRPELREALAEPLRQFLLRQSSQPVTKADASTEAARYRDAIFPQLTAAGTDDEVAELWPLLNSAAPGRCCRCPRRLRRLLDAVRLDFRVAFRRDSFLQFMRRFDVILRCPNPEAGRFPRNRSLETLHLS